MSKRIAMNVSLTAELAGFIAAKVASGRYGSASEVVRMGLRLLEERDAQTAPYQSAKSRPQESAARGR
jgi:antitoxin ParD1/3/4